MPPGYVIKTPEDWLQGHNGANIDGGFTLDLAKPTVWWSYKPGLLKLWSISAVKLQQSFGDMVDRSFFVRAARLIGARRSTELQVNQFVHNGELHVPQDCIGGRLVIGRVQHTDHGGLLLRIPADVTQRSGSQTIPLRRDHSHAPVFQLEPLLPKRKLFVEIALR